MEPLKAQHVIAPSAAILEMLHIYRCQVLYYIAVFQVFEANNKIQCCIMPNVWHQTVSSIVAISKMFTPYGVKICLPLQYAKCFKSISIIHCCNVQNVLHQNVSFMCTVEIFRMLNIKQYYLMLQYSCLYNSVIHRFNDQNVWYKTVLIYCLLLQYPKYFTPNNVIYSMETNI